MSEVAAAGDSSNKIEDVAQRTAVVIVHGIGNQRPLATTRDIVNALYLADPDIAPKSGDDGKAGDDEKKTWVALDRTVGDVDLPIVTTARVNTRHGRRNIDFHEFYWAPEMSEVRFVAVPLWLFELVRKGSSAMLPDVKPLWGLIGGLLAFWLLAASLVGISGAAALIGLPHPAAPMFDFKNFMTASALGAVLPWFVAALFCRICMGKRGVLLLLAVLFVGGLVNAIMAWACGNWPQVVLPMTLGNTNALVVATIGLAIFVGLNSFILLTVVGDAARYLRSAPENIAVRRRIRALGATMLERLHGAKTMDGEYRYDRIIILSHSLGTIIAYDVLRAHFSAVAKSLGNPRKLATGETQDNASAPSVNEWHGNCRTLVDELAASDAKKRWIVTDFVTLGSPLAQAEFLLADGTSLDALTSSLKRKFDEREFPMSPVPLNPPDGHLSFPFQNKRLFHTGALFGITRWTNLFFPSSRVLWGDMVGGPVGTSARTKKELFGTTIHDVAVSGAPANDWLAHTHYWNVVGTDEVNDAQSSGRTHFLKALRQAVNLRDQ